MKTALSALQMSGFKMKVKNFRVFPINLEEFSDDKDKLNESHSDNVFKRQYVIEVVYLKLLQPIHLISISLEKKV